MLQIFLGVPDGILAFLSPVMSQIATDLGR